MYFKYRFLLAPLAVLVSLKGGIYVPVGLACVVIWAWLQTKEDAHKKQFLKEQEENRENIRSRFHNEFHRVIESNSLREKIFQFHSPGVLHVCAHEPRGHGMFRVQFWEDVVRIRMANGKLYGARYSDEFQLQSLIETGADSIRSLLPKEATSPKYLAEIEDEFNQKVGQGFFDV